MKGETLLEATDQMRSCNRVRVALKVNCRKGRRRRFPAEVASVRKQIGWQTQIGAGMSDEIKRQYVNYLFFKVDPSWRRLSREERDRGKGEFEGVIKDWKGRCLIIPFTTVGTRADTDFVVWRISERLEDFTEMSAPLLNGATRPTAIWG